MFRFSCTLVVLAGGLAAVGAFAAPIHFDTKGGAVTLEERPYTVADRCRSDACAAVRDAILGTQAPKTVLSRLEVTVQGKSYRLDTSGMVDPLIGPREQAGQAIRLACDETGACTVRGVFGDGGAAYACEWVIRGGKSARTVFTPSNDIGHFLRENLVAPTYH
jgi:hypothetical protein